MIAIPLPCNITEHKTLAICRVIFIWASNILWLRVYLFGRKGAKLALLTLKVADPCVRVTGLSENLGTRLKCVFYPKYYTFILK